MRWIKACRYYITSLMAMVIHFKNWPELVSLFLRRTSSGTRTVIFRRKPIRMIVRSAMDVWSVKETFLDQFYTRYGEPIQNGWTVIDIGAGIGDFSLYAAFANPFINVYAFEPFPESYELLRRNLALNGVKNVQVFQNAVWSTSGELDLDLTTGEPLQFSSQLKIDNHPVAGKIAVRGLSLDEIFRINSLHHVDLIKMDCEGAEYEILLTTPAATLQRIERIIMEYHDVDAVRTHLVLADFLRKQGFSVTCYDNFVHKHIGYLFASR